MTNWQARVILIARDMVVHLRTALHKPITELAWFCENHIEPLSTCGVIVGDPENIGKHLRMVVTDLSVVASRQSYVSGAVEEA